MTSTARGRRDPLPALVDVLTALAPDAKSVGRFDRPLVKAEATSEEADALALRLRYAVHHLCGRPGFAFDAVLDDR